MGCWCSHSERVKMGQGSRWASVTYFLTVNSKKETNSRVKMGKESKWAKSQDGLPLFTPWKSQNGLLLFTPWQSQTNRRQQERNKEQGQNGQRDKMGFCYLQPERVKMGLLLFILWQSQTNSEQQERNKQQGQNGQRVKMGQGLRWASIIYPLKESKWAAVVYPLTESN